MRCIFLFPFTKLFLLQKMMNLTRRIPLYLNSMFDVKKGGRVLKVLCYLFTWGLDISDIYFLFHDTDFCLVSPLHVSRYWTNALCCLSVGTVKSDELKWLPNGSEFILNAEKSAPDSTSKTKTYTSFGCSQDTLPEFLNNPIALRHDDIILAKLGPGQVCLSWTSTLRSLRCRDGIDMICHLLIDVIVKAAKVKKVFWFLLLHSAW